MDKIPNDFDWEQYIKLNIDLTQYIKNEAIDHFLKYGINENRLYKIDYNQLPSDFDWKTYLELNKDLTSFNTESSALNHYLTHGIKEKRIYKKNIDNKLNKFVDNQYNDTVNNKYDDGIDNKANININIYTLNNDFDYIYDDDILYTRPFYIDNPNYLKYNFDISLLNSLNSFIFIIDFNNGGGGTTIFLNTIVSKYKKYNTFLILRFDGSKYYLNVDEEYLITPNFPDTDSIINFLENKKTNIQKIFINHLLGYDKKFINYILNLNITKIGITHDYYNIFSIPQPKFNSILNSKINDNININKFDKIITQDETNLTIFSKYYKKNFDVVKLPDFLFQ